MEINFGSSSSNNNSIFKRGILSSDLVAHFGKIMGLEMCLNIYPTRP